MVTHEYIHEVKLRGGNEGQVPAVVVMELSNGKITQVRHYIDKLEAAKQMASGAAKLAVGAVAKQVEAVVNP
jgi:limonene-1,2-epoxide hydrolase